MRSSHAVWIVGLLTAALGAAGVSVHAGAAAPNRATMSTSTTDATYSCRVRPGQHVVQLYGSVTLPSVQNKPQPGVLVLTTGVKTVTRNDTTTTVSQVGLRADKKGLKIDKSSCRRVKQQIPLKPKGLPTPGFTVTPTHQGFDNEQCDTTARVLARIRVQTTNQIPSHALFAIRNEGAHGRAIAFYNWSPSKLTVYPGNSCTSS